MSVKINKTSAAVIIDGPDGELNCREENSPIKTDNNPPTTDNFTICCGLLEIFLDIAAGIISIPVIRSSPTILIDIAIIAANNIVKIAFALSGFIPSASASSLLTVEANNGFQIILRIKRIIDPPNQIINKSISFTASISPNNKPMISNLIEDKKLITTKPTANDEWANKPSKASPGNFVVFCNFKSISATAEEIKKTEKATLILKKNPIVTPNKAE